MTPPVSSNLPYLLGVVKPNLIKVDGQAPTYITYFQGDPQMDVTPVSFDINLVGEITSDIWKGTFKSKRILSPGERIQIDRIRRDLLGPRSEEASEGADNRASLAAECAVRIVEAPEWWKSSQFGLNLYDENVLIAVFEAAIGIEKAERAKLQEKSKLAAQELKKTIEKLENPES